MPEATAAIPPLTLEEALDACVAYARHKTHFDLQQKKFVQDAHDGRPTDLSHEEQFDLLALAANSDPEKYEKMAQDHKKERLLQALKDGRVLAWGYLTPYKPHDQKQRIEPHQWSYLQLGDNVAEGVNQIYTALQFAIRPDSITAIAARNAARSKGGDIITIFDDNEAELRPLTHDLRAKRIKQIAEAKGFETRTGYGTSNIRMILQDSSRLSRSKAPAKAK